MSKLSDLLLITDPLTLRHDGDIPHGVNVSSQPDLWNPATVALKALAALIGADFADTDGQLAALQAFFSGGVLLPAHVPISSEWVVEPSAPTFIAPTQFSLPGDHRSDYLAGHRVRANLGPSTTVVSNLTLNSLFTGIATIVTLADPVLTSALTAVSRGLVRGSVPLMARSDLQPGAAGVLRAVAAQGVGDPVGTTVTGAETFVYDLPFTAHGGLFVILGWLGGDLATADLEVVTARMRVDGNPAVIDGAVVRSASVNLVEPNGRSEWFLPLLYVSNALSPPYQTTDHRAKLTWQVVGASPAFVVRRFAMLLVLELT